MELQKVEKIPNAPLYLHSQMVFIGLRYSAAYSLFFINKMLSGAMEIYNRNIARIYIEKWKTSET